MLKELAREALNLASSVKEGFSHTKKVVLEWTPKGCGEGGLQALRTASAKPWRGERTEPT